VPRIDVERHPVTGIGPALPTVIAALPSLKKNTGAASRYDTDSTCSLAGDRGRDCLGRLWRQPVRRAMEVLQVFRTHTANHVERDAETRQPHPGIPELPAAGFARGGPMVCFCSAAATGPP
jgi:hypothetical protein